MAFRALWGAIPRADLWTYGTTHRPHKVLLQLIVMGGVKAAIRDAVGVTISFAGKAERALVGDASSAAVGVSM
jgi:hypothetical protein